MDYQFVCVLQFVIALLGACLNSVNGIIGRDLVLTPKQGLQLNGKSIYYEEESSEVLRNQSEVRRPWERTLKHVTFVTLFTDAAAGAVSGNVSQLKEYHDFLRIPYLSQRGAPDARFGDIVTLATGRLEEADEHDAENAAAPYRFVEGVCDYSCAEGRVLALWQVQKIRHHDATNRKFRYEIKFSISPLGRRETASSGGGGGGSGSNNRWTAEPASLERRENSLQTFIQKEDDYPQSFGRIIYPDEADEPSVEKANSFAERRHDDEFAAGRNFRHVSQQHGYTRQQATDTSVPEATFMRGIFQAPPPPPEKLNIGEQYIKNYLAPSTVGIAAPKIELYPNLQNTVSRHGAASPIYTHYAPHTPTTYRPNYQEKFPRPEFYHPSPPLPHKLMRYPPPSSVEHTSSAAVSASAAATADVGKLSMPLVTHHFHHHFYMPSSSSVENGLSASDEQTSTNGYKQTTAGEMKRPPSPQSQTPSYYTKYGSSGYDETQMPPAPQKFVFPVPSSLHDAEDVEAVHGLQQHTLVHVTPPPPVPPLRRPQIYQMYHHPPPPLPLLIYPAPVEEVTEPHYDVTSPRLKPFLQSESLDERNVRYSEPDPLYFPNASNAPTQQAGGEAQSYELTAPQLEAPARNKIVAETSQYGAEEYTPKTPTDHNSSSRSKIPTPDSQPPDSIVAQLPPPDKDQDVRIPYVDEDEQDKGESATELTNKSATQPQQDLEQKPSLNDLTISTEKSTAATIAAADDAPPQSATVTPITTPPTTQAISANNNTPEIATTSTTFTSSSSSSSSSTSSGSLSAASNAKLKKLSKNSIVSTSTTESPLRAVSRHRGSGGGGYVPPRIFTSTTEAPVLKWKPRRRANYTSKFTGSNSTFLKSKPTGEDSRAKSSERHEEKLKAVATTAMPQNVTVAPTTAPTLLMQNATVAPPTPAPKLLQSESNEIFEVLTQKSVSKSVSIKVGSKGEEIPIIIDDANDSDEENEVKRE